jgi:hypothetical protein
MNKNYQFGLLCLTHLLICADGVEHKSEIDAMKIIRNNARIGDPVFEEFRKVIASKSEREIYHHGIEHLNLCSDIEKLNVFVTLYKLSEVDGRVHVKEIRLLLYSIKLAGIEFNDVVNMAMQTPPII